MRRGLAFAAILAFLAFQAILAFAPARASADEAFTPFLTSSTGFDPVAQTISLPLYAGVAPDGSRTWYVITESSDKDDAQRLGVNWSGKLANALGTAAVQSVTRSGGLVRFSGTVDFSPAHVVQAGPTGFPPAQAQPGSVGDPAYSPLITTGDGIVRNAPQVANTTGRHDRVVAIDALRQRVTLHTTNGFYGGHAIQYISFDASFSVAAALESATYAPNLNAAPGLGSNDPKTSARASIVPIINGATDNGDPQQQGLSAALLHGVDPLNITITHSGDVYSPIWDVHAAVWTDAAIASGQRVRLTSTDQVANAVEHGLIVTPFTGPANKDLGGLRASGFIVNCPIMAMR